MILGWSLRNRPKCRDLGGFPVYPLMELPVERFEARVPQSTASSPPLVAVNEVGLVDLHT